MDCDLSREINLGICGTLFLQIPLASGKASLVPDETSVLLSRVLDSETTTCVHLERCVEPRLSYGLFCVSVGRPVPRRVVSFLRLLIDPRRVTERDFSPLKIRLQTPQRSSLAFPCARCPIT